MVGGLLHQGRAGRRLTYADVLSSATFAAKHDGHLDRLLVAISCITAPPLLYSAEEFDRTAVSISAAGWAFRWLGFHGMCGLNRYNDL